MSSYETALEDSLRAARNRIDRLERQKSEVRRCLAAICDEIEGGNQDWAFYKAFLATKAREILESTRYA